MSTANPATEIEAMLDRAIGLDIHSVGSSMVALAVQTRMKKRGIGGMEEYAALLAASDAEMQALVEEIVVPETWFFRDRQPFLLLADWAAKEWLPAHPYETLRILSIPCSTGEEPYSIVMALLDAGISPDRFSVEAVDISAVALQKAHKGVYSRNSFRGQFLDYREKYFRETPQGWALDEAVRSQVRFRQANVLDTAFAHKEGALNVIFCRNMLIYFGEAPRARVMNKLGELLSPEGLLFLGHAESPIARSFGFEPIAAPMAFAFRKERAGAAPEPPPRARKAAVAKPAGNPPAGLAPGGFPKPPLLPLPPKRKPVAKQPPAPAPAPSAEALLAQARECADAGRFDAARTHCEAALEAQGSSSEAYYLLGLIEDAAGNAGPAEAFYRKALYLEPDHCEALFQLALLTKKCGDGTKARQLQERARRAQTKWDARTNAT